mgnify:CR=1 FL=1
MKGKNESIFRCKDPNGISINCSRGNWEHATEHKEMIGQQGVAKAVLETPDFINRDLTNKKRSNYYKLLVLPNIGSTYVRVTVQRSAIILRKTGYVITSHACNNEKKGEIRLWTKNQNPSK